MSELLYSLIKIDRTKGPGLVSQLTNELRRLISDGHLMAGHALPSSRSLADQIGVSRNTVTFAVEQLAAEGYVSVSQGRRPCVMLQSTVGDDRQKGPGSIVRPPRPLLKKSISRLNRSSWPAVTTESIVPFRQGRADSREFPHDTWARCLRRAARKDPESHETPLNRPSLQKALCRHLIQYRGVSATPDQVLVVPTAQSGLNLIADMVLEPDDVAWTESPGYAGARVAIESHGGDAVGIALDEHGMSFDQLDHPSPKLIFTTPTHQFPTGRLMSVNRRLKLLAVAESRNAWIIEDDYDGEFHFDERPVPALQGLDQSDRVFYLGTFAKSTFADIRLGYIVVPRQVLDDFKLAQLRYGLLASIHIQEALAEFISDGHFVAHIKRTRRLYHERRDYLADALRREVGDYFRIEKPAGGMQLVAWSRTKIADRKLTEQLAEAGVVARPVSPMFIGEPQKNGLLLGFAAWQTSEIEKAVGTLRDIVAALTT